MAIEFVCAKCSCRYRVKDELAGKTAKCGKCGGRLEVPQLVTGGDAAPRPTRSPAATSQPLNASTAAPQNAAGRNQTSPDANRSAAPKQPPSRPEAPRQTAASAAASSDLGSWLDDELIAAPVAPRKPPAPQATCQKCGKQQPSGSMICASCGETMPVERPVSGRSSPLQPATAQGGSPGKKLRKRTIKFDFQLGSVGTLIRGTLLSGVFTLVGAAIWAVVAYLTQREFAVIAWGMGGLAGMGMAVGHDDDDGTLAGIIAAFVSLFGIVAAKVLIIVVFIAAAVAGAVADLELDDLHREMVIHDMAQESLKQRGGNPDNVSEEQREKAVAAAREKVDAMDDAQIEEKFHALEAKWEAEADAAEIKQAANDPPGGDPPGDEAAAAKEAPDPALAQQAEMVDVPQQGPGLVSLFFQEMFSPIDGLFILLAFCTAYKLGSGQQGD